MKDNLLHQENLYNINHWGEGYFHINPRGNIEISKNHAAQGVELQAIVHAASRAGLKLPLLIRFTNILHDRVSQLYFAFSQAITETNYSGNYQLVYPIKVNQESCVVRTLLNAPQHHIGLEAGSKPELMAVIGLLDSHGPTTIVCNGYKDAGYIRAALIAQQMGHQVFIIIEKRSELEIILREAARLEVKPCLGVRIRLVTKCVGKWENTGGAKSKFGLNAEQVLDLVHQLKSHQALDCLQLMHCHLGSQIANIDDIRSCMQEVTRYYTELRRLNAPISTIDVGGGLAVDYEGTHSNTDCSMNYSLKEYATNIFLTVKALCLEATMPEPNIISESGRSLTAHHAVIITNITDIDTATQTPTLPIIEPNDSRVILDIWNTYQVMAHCSPRKIYHDAEHALTEAHAMFKQGLISLTEKAKVEQLYTAICLKIKARLDEKNSSDHVLMNSLNERLAAKIFCNLSFFQSIPDAWAIGQLVPIAPISQLTEKRSMHAILQDLTCDSDGTLKRYTGDSGVMSTLLLPNFDVNKPYDIAFFLVGAYQEILGNLHNLFGDINSLDVTLTDHGGFEINELISGDTMTDVLNIAHYDTTKFLQSYEKQLIQTELSDEQIEVYLSELCTIFTQLTYLDSNKTKG